MDRVRIRPLLAAVAVAALGAIVAPTVKAQSPSDTAAPAEASSELAEGEVRRIDKSQGRVNLRHGEIKSLEMSPMSMWFVLKDPTWADGLKVGDKVRFAAEKVGAQYTITQIETAR